MPREPLPGGFSFVPRHSVLVRAAFGKTSTPIECSDTGSRYAAIQLQHLIANAIRESVAARYGHISRFLKRNADRLPEAMTLDRVGRTLRGETALTLADLLFWTAEFPDVARLAAELLDSGGGHPDARLHPPDAEAAPPGNDGTARRARE